MGPQKKCAQKNLILRQAPPLKHSYLSHLHHYLHHYLHHWRIQASVCASDRTRSVWKFLSTVCQTDTGMKLAELEHSSLKKCIPFCSGRVPILVHLSLYRSLKLRYPFDVGGISRSGWVTSELCTGSLHQAVGILTPKDFRPVVANE